jgi:hypothetical protein
MECCFSVEAKGFSFSAKAKAFELCLEERRMGFCGFIFGKIAPLVPRVGLNYESLHVV